MYVYQVVSVVFKTHFLCFGVISLLHFLCFKTLIFKLSSSEYNGRSADFGCEEKTQLCISISAPIRQQHVVNDVWFWRAASGDNHTSFCEMESLKKKKASNIRRGGGVSEGGL